METCRCGGNSTAFLFIDVCNTPVNANVFHHFCRAKDMQIKKNWAQFDETCEWSVRE